jgi:Holliday junction resolvasome RuvABC DNA-binding subunit
VRPPAVGVAEQVFGALRHMGFHHSEARARMDAVAREGAPDGVEAFLRAALRAC